MSFAKFGILSLLAANAVAAHSQNVLLNPSGNQTVTQPAGTAMSVNNLNAQGTINGVFNPVAYGASGSNQTTTGTISAGSKSLVLASAIDFKNGQGILILHAGTLNSSLVAPTVNTVSPQGGSGSTTYSYCVAALDANGGESACSATFTTTAGPSSLGTGSNNILQVFNYIFTAPVGIPAVGYATYQEPSGKILGIMMIPAGCLPWKADYTYPAGFCVVPDTPTGYYYSTPNGGTSGTAQPAFCTTRFCTTSDNSVNWSMQQWHMQDDEQTTWNVAAPPQLPITVAANAPSSPLADSLVTTVSSGSGTTALTLATAAIASVSAGEVLHDDTVAMQNTINAAAAASSQLFLGVYEGTAPRIQIPSGYYNISAALSLTSLNGQANIWGAGYPFIIQNNWSTDILDDNSLYAAYKLTVCGLQFVGGQNQVSFENDNLDQSRLRIDDVDFYNSYGFSIFTMGLGSDYHISMIADISHIHSLGSPGVFLSVGDFDTFRDSWIGYSSSSLNRMYGGASFANLGVTLTLDNVQFVPGGGAVSSNLRVPGIHYVDNRGSFYSNRSRYGAEGPGGYPIVYNYANVESYEQYGSNIISIKDSTELGVGASLSGDTSVVYLVSGIPNILTIVNNINAAPLAPLIAIAPSFNVNEDVMAAYSAGTVASYPIVQMDIQGNVPMPGLTGEGSTPGIPTSLLPYILPEEFRRTTAEPTDGFWAASEQVRTPNFYNGASAPHGWITTQTGLAAPIVARSTAYTVGQFVDNPTNNGHVYMCTVAGMTASSAPTYSTSGATTDGTAVFNAEGSSAQFASF